MNQSEKAIPYSIIRPVFLILLVMLGACRRAEVAEEPEAVASNEALRQLYEEDQQERVGWEQLSEKQLQEVFVRDKARRIKVDEILAAGRAGTSDDYYHAAMVFQHGEDSTDFRKAYEAARQAVALDSTHALAGWLSAASWDRYQITIAKPQWYGTQYFTQNGVTVLQPIDTARVTDQERQRLGVLTLQQTQALLHCTNTEENMTLGDCMLRQVEQNQAGSDR